MSRRVGLRHVSWIAKKKVVKHGILAIYAEDQYLFHSRFFDGVTWEAEKTNETDNTRGWMFGATSESGVAHLAYSGYDAGTKLIYEKYVDGWGNKTILETDGDIAYECPTISVDANGNLFVIWASRDQDKVFYRRYDKAGDSWAARQTWSTEVFVDDTNQDHAFGQAYGNKIGFVYRAEPLVGSFGLEFAWVDTETLTYSTPVTFDTSDNNAGFTYQRKSLYAAGLFWIFYEVRYGNIYYRTSSDGITWSARTFVTSVVGGNAWDFDLWFDGTYLHYVAKAEAYKTVYRRGTPISDGSITWSAAEQVVTSTKCCDYPTVTVDALGYPFIGYRDDDDLYPYVTKSSKNDGTWVTASGYPFKLISDAEYWFVRVLPI